MLRIKSIKLQNFRSFKSSQTVEFENGFYCIKGLSGVGKSNLFLGISYALGVCAVPATQLQNCFVDDPMQVTLVLEDGDRTITVKRGKETSYADSLGGTVNGASAVNQKIDELFKGRTQAIEMLTVRNQRTPGNFLSLKDSQQESFLSSVLGLNSLEEFIDKTAAQIKEQKEKLSAIESEIDGLRKAKNVINISGEVELQLKLEKLTEEGKALSAEYKSVKNSIESVKLEIETQSNKVLEKTKEFAAEELSISDRISSAKLLLSTLNSELKGVKAAKDTAIYEVDSAKNKITLLKKELISVEDNIAKLQKNLCYVCQQPFEENSIKLSELMSRSVEIKQAIESLLIKTNIDFQPFLAKTEELITKGKEIESQKVELEKQLADIKLKKASTDEAELLRGMKVRQGQLETILQEILNKAKTLESSINIVKTDLSNISRNQENVKKIDQKILDALVIAEKQKDILDKLVLTNNVNKEFLTKIFDEILAEITDKINKDLAYIPNVKNISFSFSTTKTAKNGKIKNTINTNIFKNGVEMPAKSGLSGGQFSSVELLVDAAVHQVVSNRTGLDVGWLILDEPFEGLHPNDKEACLQILKILHQNKTVLVIDHSTETKESFDYFVNISADENGFSVVGEG